jgi:hypothetical protein
MTSTAHRTFEKGRPQQQRNMQGILPAGRAIWRSIRFHRADFGYFLFGKPAIHLVYAWKRPGDGGSFAFFEMGRWDAPFLSGKNTTSFTV